MRLVDWSKNFNKKSGEIFRRFLFFVKKIVRRSFRSKSVRQMEIDDKVLRISNPYLAEEQLGSFLGIR